MRTCLSELIGSSIALGLIDKSLEKRISSAQDLEMLVSKKFGSQTAESRKWAEECMTSLKEELLQSSHMQSRGGGLMALASVVIGLRDSLREDLQKEILHMCLEMVDDEEPRVRYMACESVFNIVKATGTRSLVVFRELFSFLCKIGGDTESDIRQTAPVLDRILREVVADHFSNPRFNYNILSAVESHLVYPNPFVKQLSLAWIEFLTTIPQSGIFDRLAFILPPLLAFLSGGSSSAVGRKDLSLQAEHVLGQLQRVAVSQPVIEQTLSVLIKYGKFQDTLSPRARIVLFRWLTVFASKSRASSESATVVKILISSIAKDSEEAVMDAIQMTNSTLLTSKEFRENLRNCENETLMNVFETNLDFSRPLVTSAVVDWITVVGDKVRFSSIEPFLRLRIDQKVMNICVSQFGLKETCHALLLKMLEADSRILM